MRLEAQPRGSPTTRLPGARSASQACSAVFRVWPTLGVTVVRAGGSSEVPTLLPSMGGCAPRNESAFTFLQKDLPRGSPWTSVWAPGASWWPWRRNCCGAWSRLPSGAAPRAPGQRASGCSWRRGHVLPRRPLGAGCRAVCQRSAGRSSARSLPRLTRWLTDWLVCLLCPGLSLRRESSGSVLTGPPRGHPGQRADSL